MKRASDRRAGVVEILLAARRGLERLSCFDRRAANILEETLGKRELTDRRNWVDCSPRGKLNRGLPLGGSDSHAIYILKYF